MSTDRVFVLGSGLFFRTAAGASLSLTILELCRKVVKQKISKVNESEQ